jgi:hypothetical protein
VSFAPTQHRGRVRRWLLDLTWAGATYYIAEDSHSATFGGVTYAYEPGLVVDSVALDVALETTEAASVSVPVALHLEGMVDVPRQVSLGWDLGAAQAKLWLWLEGSDHRELVVDGVVADPEYGAVDEPVICSVADTRAEDTRRFPPQRARVDLTTWPAMTGQSVHEFYPWVFGTPGDSATGAFGGPGLVVDATIEITGSAYSLDFIDFGGGAVANLSTGNYTPSELGAEIGSKMTAAGALSYSASIEPGTGLWTIRANASFTLSFGSGPNLATSAAAAIGFDAVNTGGTDTSYTGQTRASGSPRKLLVAGHSVGATIATVVNANDESADTLNITEGEDGRGRLVSWVSLAGSDVTREITAPYYVRLGSGGGLLYEGSLVEGAGDLLVWALEQTSLVYDLPAVRSMRPYLNGFVLGGVVMAAPSEPVSMWEWLQREVLPFLPVSVTDGPNGVGFILWRWEATASDAVAHLRVGENCDRTGRVSYTPRAEVVNELRLSYAMRYRDRKMTRTLVYSGDPAVVSAEGATSSALLRSSWQRHGTRPQAIACSICYSEATANLIAGWMTRARAAQGRILTLRCEPSVAAHLRRGDVVQVSDPDLHMVGMLAFVMGLPKTAGEYVDVEVRSIPVR